MEDDVRLRRECLLRILDDLDADWPAKTGDVSEVFADLLRIHIDRAGELNAALARRTDNSTAYRSDSVLYRRECVRAHGWTVVWE
ncbi:hypothetical protein ACFO5R_01075 [Halosolutus amylolyticus]|uniref:Uncharacterized protein n=1 Tax=Halosolutus amylolyticus TaxID=2932267 RepID=A0ABD5PJJ1_9EURY|nr:hypothetical protein [Halosolutus amylolyticus]